MAEPVDRARLAKLCYDLFEVDRRGQVIFSYLAGPRWCRKPTGTGIDQVLDMARCAAWRELLDDLVLLINEGRDPEPAAAELEIKPD